MNFVLCWCALALPAAGAVHVSPDGDDGGGDGSVAKPFASVARALAEEGDALEIVMADGEYFLSEPIRVSRAGVSLRAANPGKVTISGGVRIRAWEEGDDGETMVARIPGGLTFRELFVDGQRATRARFPDEGFLRIERAGADRRTSFTVPEKDVGAVARAAGAELMFMHDWSCSRVRVKSFNSATRVLTVVDPIGNTNGDHYAIDHFEKHPRYWLEDSKAFLDREGEWFLDRAAGVLLVRSAAKPNDVVAPRSEGLLVADGAGGLRVEGIAFRHSAWRLPAGGLAASQAAFHQGRLARGDYRRDRVPAPPAVLVERSSGVRFVDCEFRQLGGSGLWFREACTECSAVRCVFDDISANGVMVGEAKDAWRPGRAETSSRVAITDCEISRCGRQVPGSVGVWVGMANHVRVEGNHLHDLSYTGVSVGWMWNPRPTGCHHNIIADNEIHDVMQALSDGGGIYTLGRQPGTVLRGNRIHSIVPNSGRAESNGMFLDQGSTDLLIEGNTIYGVAKSPLRFHQAGENLVRGNRFFLAGRGVPAVRYNNTPEANITLEANEIKVGTPAGE